MKIGVENTKQGAASKQTSLFHSLLLEFRKYRTARNNQYKQQR